MEKRTDDQLLSSVRSGDEEALGMLIDRYTAYVGTVVHNIVSGKLGAEDEKDILSDCFCLLWQNAEKVQPGKLKAYLAAIARSRALNALRRLRTEDPLEDAVLTLRVPGPETETLRQDAQDALRRSLDALGEPDRSIFFRHYYYCQSAAEIGAALGINPNTVHTKLRRGREKLRQELEKGGYTLETEISDCFDPGTDVTVSGEGLPCSPAEIRELTLKKLHTQKVPQRGHILRLTGRGLLIAAVLACLMTVTAVAAGLSIHQRRQEELREELNITENGLGNYMEFSVPQESEPPEAPSVTVLSAINDGSRQIVFLDLCPVSIQEFNHLRAQAENRSGAMSSRTNSLELYMVDEVGNEYSCGGVYPFFREDGSPMYDYETHTLTCAVTIGTDRVHEPGSAVCIRLEMLDRTRRLVRNYGIAEIDWTECVERRIFFDEPVVFQTPDTGEEGSIVGIELSNASFAWLIEIPAEALQAIFPAYGQFQTEEDWDTYSRAIKSWLDPLLYDYLQESGVTLSDGRWFGGPWQEGAEPWIFSYTDGTYLKIGFSSMKPVMNPKEVVSTTIHGVILPLR